MTRSIRISSLVLAALFAAFGMAFPLGSPGSASTTEPQRARRKPAAPAAAGPSLLRTPAGAAPQSEVDAALFLSQPFFDVQARLPRPYAEARDRLEALGAKYPSDAGLARRKAWLDERLGRFDAAAGEMEHYATLAGRSPDALRRLAHFYRGRGLAAAEVRALDELAGALPPGERVPVYRRAIDAVNDARPAGLTAEPYYAKILDVDANDGDTLRDYVSLLLSAGDSSRALQAIDRAAAAPGYRTFAMRRLALSERARVYDMIGSRKAALEVYERQFDPRWPRAIVSDYYALLSRYGLYRERRRALQAEAARGGASLARVARLFNVYAYEGNLPAAAGLLASLERARAGAPWGADELELVADLYAQVGDFDQASRYLYTTYLLGGLRPGSPEREEALARLFTILVEARDEATRLAPGGISLYRDIARLDARPGALNGLLSLILAGNDPGAEYALEEARAGGYLNRALAHTIYTSFGREFARSPRLGEMTVSMLEAFADLGMNREVVQVGTDFLAAHPAAGEYERVSLAVADAHVRLKDRAGERAILSGLLDRVAGRQGKRPLLARNASRTVFEPAPDPVEDELHGGGPQTDAPPDLFVAPNGRLVPEEKADAFAPDDASAGGDGVYEPTDDSSGEGSSEESLPEDYTGEEERASSPVTYSQLLERTIASFEADERKTEALAFFWAELSKHPTDEGLHERFLRWLGAADLVNDQLKAYRAALDRYDDATWMHRLARWYARKGRQAELRKFNAEVVRTLGDEEVERYLDDLAEAAGVAESDRVDFDNAIALQATRLAHARFPNNVAFVKLLLARLAIQKNWAEWEKLSREYFFTDREVRAGLLRRLSEVGRLEKDYALARERGAGGPAGEVTSSFAYAVFAADSARWLSKFDEAILAYRRLVELYPGERQYAEPLADLLRSFGSQDPALYAQSAAVFDRLAAVYPTDHRYPTRAGDALAQAGDVKAAAERWRGLASREPGNPATRLEVATLFWDYYQFDDAARELEALRAASGDRALYAFRLGAIYDGKRDWDRAVPEYVRALNQAGGERDGAAGRLAELATRQGFPARIESAYQAERTAAPDDWQMTLGYADFLRALGRTKEAVALLDREVDARHDVVFLGEARNRFRSWRSPEGERHALARIAEEARDERERIQARLQLAALNDEQNRRDDAVKIFEELAAEHPTNAGVLEEAARYLWRVGQTEKSARLYRATIDKAQGDYRERFGLDLARRQVEAGDLAGAEATLRGLAAEMPVDMDVFQALARVLARAGKQEELATVYRETLARVRDADLESDNKTETIADLRRGMIGTLGALGRHADAVDQYIEIINRDPESSDLVDAGFDYAARHDLTPRLVGYYEKLAQDSIKDFRWSLVLARLYDRAGNLSGAAASYQRVVVNEPQRVDLRGALADALARANREDDAVAEFRRAWQLDGQDPAWLVRAARVRAREGRLDEAAALVDEAVAGRKTSTPARTFELAEMLAGWGLFDKSLELYDRGLDAARRDPARADLDLARLGGWVRTATRARPAVEVFRQLEELGRFFESAGGRADSDQGESAKVLARHLGEVGRGAFGSAVVDYASPEEKTALDAAVRTAASARTDRDSVRDYLVIAREAGLSGAEEAVARLLADRAFEACAQEGSSPFESALADLVDVFARSGQYARAAEALAAYRDRGQGCVRYAYDTAIAENYRLAGDAAREIAALERFYSNAGTGAATEGSAGGESARRLFELLLKTDRQRLVALAATSSPYQLVLVNFLIERGEGDLARQAIGSAGLSPAWVKARTAQLGLYFRDGSPAVEAAFRDVLAARPIGELVGKPVDPKQRLVGADYFLTARNYGIWLDLVANRGADARGYIVGQIERRPSDGAAQAQLARYYVSRGAAGEAEKHAALAYDLAPTDRDVLAARGEVFFASNQRDRALEAWTGIIKRSDPGAEDYRLFWRELSERGLVTEALGALGTVIADEAVAGRFARVRELLGDMADFGRAHPEHLGAIVDAVYGAALAAPEDIDVAEAALAGELLPAARRPQFFRLYTDRIEGRVFAQLADPNGASGFWRGQEWFDPVAALNDARKRNVDFLIEQKAYAEALALIDSAAAEQMDQRGTLRDDDESHDYTWLDLARATVRLREGRRAEAVLALERYCAHGASDAAGAPDPKRCLEAAVVLRAGGADAEADGLLEKAYRELIDGGRLEPANFAGLAEVLYRRGRADEADGVLRRLAARDGDSPANLATAADAAARGGRFTMALELRESVARLAPADAENKLELARLRGAAGNVDQAIGGMIDVALDERAANRTRAAAVDAAAEAAQAHPAPRAAAVARLGAPTSEHGRVLAAKLLLAGGDADGARRALGALAASSLSPLAAVELGRLEMAAGRAAPAILAFERALALDPAESLADATAFAGPTPVEALIRLYAKGGRAETALRLATARKESYGGGDGAGGGGARYAFDPESAGGPGGAGFSSLTSRSADARRRERLETLAALAESATQLARWDEALAYARTRTMLFAGRTAERAESERQVAELETMRRQAARRTDVVLQVGAAPADETVSVRDFVLD